MYQIKTSSQWNYNYSAKRTDYGQPCAVCGKRIKPENQKHFVRLFWGTTAVTEAEANEIIVREGSGGDLLYYPVGSDCLRRQPELKPYVEDAARANESSHIDEFIETKNMAIEASLINSGWGKPSRVRDTDIEAIEAAESKQVDKLSKQIEIMGDMIKMFKRFDDEIEKLENIINEPDKEKRAILIANRQKQVDQTNLELAANLKKLAATSDKDTSKIDALIQSLESEGSDQ